MQCRKCGLRYFDECVHEEGICYMCGGACSGAPDLQDNDSSSHPCLCNSMLGNGSQRWSTMISSRSRLEKLLKGGDCEWYAMTLVEVLTDNVNSVEELAQQWEDIEFLVDSGASATVVGGEMVRAVRAADPNPKANYRLADGSTLPNQGYKHFVGVTEEGFKRTLKASVTDVDRPLLSVSQIVKNGSKVVFSPQGSYVENPRTKERLVLEQKGGLFTLKMWIPREENQQRAGEPSFHGQASGRP